MRTVLEKRSLNKVLAVLSKVVGKSRSLPSLALMRVSCFIGYAEFQATDLETYLTIQVPVEQTLDAGMVCVSAERFLKLAKAGNGKGKLKLFTKNGELVFQSGDVKGETFLFPVGECPNFPMPTYQSTLPTRFLLSAIEKVGFAVPSKSDYRDLRYVLVDGEGKNVDFVASDGYRLAFMRVEVPFDGRIKLPYKSLKVLKELLKKEQRDTVKVGKSDDFVFIAGSDWELALRVLEWDYPDYKAVFPQEFKTRVLVDIKELDRALESFSNLEMVVFHIGEGLTLRAEWSEYGEEHKVEVEVPARVEGKGLVIAFNPKFIKQFTEINEGAVEMLLIDEENPVVFKLGEEYFYLAMPMRMR
jgi:DNA polymerase-3 subunit beta